MKSKTITVAGNVDDGKSTLVGRILYDTNNIKQDILENLKVHSNGSTDLSKLTDGLKKEKDGNITMDIAYRYFYNNDIKFTLIDAPGHSEYTKFFFTGATKCDIVIILIDITKGISSQSEMHMRLSSKLRIPQWILVINKMDAFNFQESNYNSIVTLIQSFLTNVNYKPIINFIPISALNGDNVLTRSKSMEWYKDESLLDLLHKDIVEDNRQDLVNRICVIGLEQHNGKTILRCSVLNGELNKSTIYKSVYTGSLVEISHIYQGDQEYSQLFAGDKASLIIKGSIVNLEGDILVPFSETVPFLRNNWKSLIFWMDEEPGIPHKVYWMQMGSRKFEVQFSTECNAQIYVNQLNEVFFNSTELCFIEPFEMNKETGRAILIDPVTLNTVAGLIHF
ncbi:GTP-binding protein [Sediminibacterium sp.]|uniref:GTP-binding protein n=1 Tax=Sediminibacterium sp. TaxID=1917865 RepID=UPI003F7042A1